MIYQFVNSTNSLTSCTSKSTFSVTPSNATPGLCLHHLPTIPNNVTLDNQFENRILVIYENEHGVILGS